jgi:hypothetical protein
MVLNQYLSSRFKTKITRVRGDKRFFATLRMTAGYVIGEVKGVAFGSANSNPLNHIIQIIVILSQTKCSEESFNAVCHLPGQ